MEPAAPLRRGGNANGSFGSPPYVVVGGNRGTEPFATPPLIKNESEPQLATRTPGQPTRSPRAPHQHRVGHQLLDTIHEAVDGFVLTTDHSFHDWQLDLLDTLGVTVQPRRARDDA